MTVIQKQLSMVRVFACIFSLFTITGVARAASDREAPSVPTGLAANSIAAGGFTVTWNASTDNVAVTGYEVFLGGVSQGTVTTTSKAFTGLQPSTNYSVTVRARDAAANWSAQSSALAVTTLADTAAPSVPVGLASSGVSSSGFTVSWTASTDNVGVTGYEVFLGGVSQGTVTATSKPFTGLQPSTNYSITVRARDGAANWSAQSAALSVTTSAPVAGPYSLSAGENDVVIAKPDGTVWAWGYNWGARSPTQVLATTTAKMVAAGGYHTLILRQDGTVLATGDNTDGQIANGTLTTAITQFTSVNVVAAGRFHSLALKTDGSIYAWGDNEYGQIGNGKITNVSAPTKIGQYSGVTQIAAGSYHSLALKGDGTVLAWGYNAYGQVGNGNTVNQTSPVAVSGLTGVIAIAAGENFSLALKSNGTVWAWGYNGSGQLGDSSNITRTAPVQVSGLTGVASISSGLQHAVALKSDGTLWAWGSNAYRQIGDGTTLDRSVATNVTVVGSATKFVAGGNSSYAVTAEGTIRSWGSFTNGVLGDGSEGVIALPFDDVKQMTMVSYSGVGDRMILRRNGTIWGWGPNFSGALGDGTTRPSVEATQVLGVTNATQIAWGPIALRNDGTVLTWGSNANGELGDGSLTNRLTPALVPNLSGVTQVASGQSHRLVLKSDGTVWTWGANNYGQLGDGTTTQRTSPSQVPNLTGVVWIAAGGSNSFAVKGDGTVWSWGYDWWASGTGTGQSSSVPIQALISNVTRVSSSGSRTIFLTSAGTVYVCGNGYLGFGSPFGSATPVQAPNMDSVVEVSGEFGFSARAADGRVWAWPALVTGIANPTLLSSATGLGYVYMDGKAVITSGVRRPAGFKALASQVANLRLIASAADTDGDGLPDAWETQVFGNLTHSASADDDQDGLTNIQEYLRGTNPMQANADGDSFADAADESPTDYYNQVAPTMVVLGGDNQTGATGQFNANPFDLAVWTTDGARPLVNAPVTFSVTSGGGLLGVDRTGVPPPISSLTLMTDVDGTVRSYYKQPAAAAVTSVIRASAGLSSVNFSSTSIAAPADTDANGLGDSWEMQYFGHLGVDPLADPDGDGLTNRQEYDLGSDPTDYFNGVLPQITSLVVNNQPGAQGIVSVRLTRVAGGALLANAPVTFTVASGATRIAATPGGASSTQVTVRTDAQGVASVYVEGSLIAAGLLSATAASGTQTASISIYITPPATDDADGNGLPDWWEKKYFGVTGVSAGADPDSDGATNLQEYVRGTSPVASDPPSSGSAAALRVFTPAQR